MILLEKDSRKLHIYQDDTTGDYYFFDGTKLVKVGHLDPIEIGDYGTDDELDKEIERHNQRVEKEMEEHPEWYDGSEDSESDKKYRQKLGRGRDESPEDREKRIKKIRDIIDDDDVVSGLKHETTDKISTERKRQLRKKAAAKKDELPPPSSVQDIQLAIEKFVASQLQKIKQRSYKIMDRRYEGSNIVRSSKLKKDQVNIPVINVYFDQSTSWTNADIRTGNEILSVLQKYVSQGKIVINVYYFDDHIYSTPPIDRGATTAGYELIEHIRATRPTNVLIMTDDDFDKDYQANDSGLLVRDAPVTRVPGAVWFVFKGTQSRDLQRKLGGRAQTKKFLIGMR